MTNISAVPKSGIVRGADLARAAAAGDRAALAVARDREAGMAMVEVASAHGDFPLRVTGKSHKRYLRDKYEDLVVYLADPSAKSLVTSAGSPNSIEGNHHD